MIVLIFLLVLVSICIICVSLFAFFAWVCRGQVDAMRWRTLQDYEKWKREHPANAVSNVQAAPSFTIMYKIGRTQKTGTSLGKTEAEAMTEFTKAKTGYSAIVSMEKT